MARLQENQDSSLLGEKPTLPKLLDLKVPAGVSDKYDKFGIILLKDEDGKKMAVIKNDCRGEAEKITLQILKKWMDGDGMSVTWESLVIALRKCAPLLADQIEMASSGHHGWPPANEQGYPPPGYNPWNRHHGYPPPSDPALDQRERWRMSEMMTNQQQQQQQQQYPMQYIPL